MRYESVRNTAWLPPDAMVMFGGLCASNPVGHARHIAAEGKCSRHTMWPRALASPPNIVPRRAAATSQTAQNLPDGCRDRIGMLATKNQRWGKYQNIAIARRRLDVAPDQESGFAELTQKLHHPGLR